MLNIYFALLVLRFPLVLSGGVLWGGVGEGDYICSILNMFKTKKTKKAKIQSW